MERRLQCIRSTKIGTEKKSNQKRMNAVVSGVRTFFWTSTQVLSPALVCSAMLLCDYY
jgi:hypothetical protein